MKLERVAIAVDFSGTSLAAARWCAKQLAPDAEIALVHCLELPSSQSVLWEALPPRDELEPQVRKRAQQRLDELLDEIGRDRGRAHVRTGHPGEEVATVASEWDVDLVVAGKHGGHHGVFHVLGSTAEQLVAACHRPVLLARSLPDGPPRTVLVPVDESHVAGQALEWASTLGRRHGVRIVAHHVVTEWYYQRVQELGTEDEAQQAQEGVEARAGKWLADFVAQYAPASDVKIHLSPGQPGFQTLAAIERFHADLVVVGSHGVKSLLGDPLARLSRFLILSSPCSVFVVPDETGNGG